jgi:hypothetical protein
VCQSYCVFHFMDREGRYGAQSQPTPLCCVLYCYLLLLIANGSASRGSSIKCQRIKYLVIGTDVVRDLPFFQS